MNPKIIVILIAIFVTYSCYTYIGYNEAIRNSRYFLMLGLSISLTSNLLWLLGLRLLNASHSIFWFGLTFDVLVTACSIYIPVMLSKVKFHSLTWVGVALIISGITLIKSVGMEK